VEDVWQTMRSAPADAQIQNDGCMRLNTLSQAGRGGPGPFGGRKIAKHFLTEGIGEALAQGLLNIMANQTLSGGQVYSKAAPCFRALMGLTIQNDADLGLELYRNSPHLWEAMLSFFERFARSSNEVQFSMCMWAGFYGSFDGADEVYSTFPAVPFLLGIIDESLTDPASFQRAFCALSDPSQMSQHVADEIVRHNGVQRLTRAVRATHSFPNFIEGNGFGLRYESLEDSIGVLKHDPTGEYRAAFNEAGLMEAVLEFMPDQYDDLYFQDHCCQTLNYLTNGNATVQHKLAKSAAIDFVKEALSVAAPNSQWPSCFHMAPSPPPSCRFTLSNLENRLRGREEWATWDESFPHP
jgi:hypothetical protein